MGEPGPAQLGGRVRLVGLKARADLIGKIGTVTAPALASNSRIPVTLDGECSGLSLKPDNLEHLDEKYRQAICQGGVLAQEEGRRETTA